MVLEFEREPEASKHEQDDHADARRLRALLDLYRGRERDLWQSARKEIEYGTPEAARTALDRLADALEKKGGK